MPQSEAVRAPFKRKILVGLKLVAAYIAWSGLALEIALMKAHAGVSVTGAVIRTNFLS